ncbi:MAG: hypothetical protein K6G10_06030 [Butyrivibrio sp.]|nr:hypothetical protein [Butyrivibrio sp.]
MQSEHVLIEDISKDLKKADDVVENYIYDTKLSGKNAMRLRLLCEETLRLAKSIIGESACDFWLEGDARVSRIYLSANSALDSDKREELISVSSTGENAAETGFFGKLLSTFRLGAGETSSWTLRDYKDELSARRCEDMYAQDAWEDLERSILANLADDIEVGIKNEKISMIVTKDFSISLENVGSRVPLISTDPFVVTSERDKLNETLDKVDTYIEDLELGKKDALHLKLLVEETLGLLNQIAGDYRSVMWFEQYPTEYCLRLTLKTQMDAAKKREMLALSTKGENKLVGGFMGKIADIVENGILDYEEVAALQQKYGTGSIGYGSLGMYSSMEGLADSGIMWSLVDYRTSLQDEKSSNEAAEEAWDELEKSVVASIAKDVMVGVKKDRIDITFLVDISK